MTESKQLFNLTAEEISTRLNKAHQIASLSPYPEAPFLMDFLLGEPKPAAVLIPLLISSGKWHVLLTRRNADLPEHSGQVAFPGGRSDPEDADPVFTALREANEEIGIAPQDVTVLGFLHDFLTITNYQVTPVVGLIPWPYELKLAAQEVSRVFTIPMDWLVDINNYEEKVRFLPHSGTPIPVIYYKEYDGEILWGASARFMKTLVDVLILNSKID